MGNHIWKSNLKDLCSNVTRLQNLFKLFPKQSYVSVQIATAFLHDSYFFEN